MSAVLCLTAAALPLARRIVALLGEGATVHGLAGRVTATEVTFTDTAAHVRGLFAAGQAVIGVCAAGILIRALAPLLADKHVEPPVLAVAVDGSSVVPLLGGHHGANALARRLAEGLGGHAALTTAGDVVLGVALDEPPPGWRVATLKALKPLAAALLAGEPVRLEGEAAWLEALPFTPNGTQTIRVTERTVSAEDPALVFHPPVLSVGVGCERGCSEAELLTLVRTTLENAGLAAGAVACVSSLDLKMDEAAVFAVARDLGVPARFFTPAELNHEAPRLMTPSAVVLRETGCPGVAEGAALAAAGAASVLVVPKVKSPRATVAVALSPQPIAPLSVGKARGTLFVVGIGPGAAVWRTPEASAAVAAASDLVGYGLYLDLLGEATLGKTRHESALGEETQRVRIALDLAAEGKTVALVCSGDPGIYALATLVFEQIDREDSLAWRRLAVSVVPGISALQAAAARAGAPVNHDFCTISLSDLLTPREMILRRLKAAAEGDFVVCFYNPVSQRRRELLGHAQAILLEHRPPHTPVILARQLGREGESLRIVPLSDLRVDDVDMLTLVIVGSTETRRVGTWVYTPRGYAAKR